MADFLWGTGSAPAGANASTTDQTGLPAWFQDYLRGSINKASSIASTPYQAYVDAQGTTIPRVAGLDQNSVTAQNNTIANQGNWQPAMSTAISNTTQGGNYDPNTLQQDFMNPYTSSVLDDLTRRSNNNFQEKVMPQVMGAFTGGGQFGSARNGRLMDQAVRDQQDTLTGQMATAGQSAWDSAQKAYSDWGNKQITSGAQLGNLATQEQNAGLKDASALDTIGRQNQQLSQQNLDIAYSDFQNQQNYSKDQASWLAGIIQGYNPPPSAQTNVQNGVSSVQSQSPLSALAGGIGTAVAGTQTQTPVAGKKRGGLITLKKGRK